MFQDSGSVKNLSVTKLPDAYTKYLLEFHVKDE